MQINTVDHRKVIRKKGLGWVALAAQLSPEQVCGDLVHRSCTHGFERKRWVRRWRRGRGGVVLSVQLAESAYSLLTSSHNFDEPCCRWWRRRRWRRRWRRQHCCSANLGSCQGSLVGRCSRLRPCHCCWSTMASTATMAAFSSWNRRSRSWGWRSTSRGKLDL